MSDTKLTASAPLPERFCTRIERVTGLAIAGSGCEITQAPAGEDGVMPVFTRQDIKVPRAIRDMAFALKTGEISGVVQVGNNYHVLKLHERVIAASVDYDSVKESLRASVRERVLEKARSDLLRDLRTRAAVEFVNPILRSQAAKLARP